MPAVSSDARDASRRLPIPLFPVEQEDLAHFRLRFVSGALSRKSGNAGLGNRRPKIFLASVVSVHLSQTEADGGFVVVIGLAAVNVRAVGDLQRHRVSAFLHRPNRWWAGTRPGIDRVNSPTDARIKDAASEEHRSAGRRDGQDTMRWPGWPDHE